MKCLECGHADLIERVENHCYAESGLPNVTLRGVLVRRCTECGAHFVSIPKLSQLHRAIALILICKSGRLSAPEIRFLRKSLGWSATDFARKLHTTPSQVSRWESERSKSRISIANELALRLLVALGQKIENYSEHIDELNFHADEGPNFLAMQREKGEWCAAT